MPDRDILKGAGLSPLAMANQWRRCVVYFTDPRFEVLTCTSPDHGHSFGFHAASAQSRVTSLRQRQTCPGCFDRAFAQEAIRMHEHDAEFAPEAMTEVLAQLPPGSASVERHHLLAQDQKAFGRGLAVAARTAD